MTNISMMLCNIRIECYVECGIWMHYGQLNECMLIIWNTSHEKKKLRGQKCEQKQIKVYIDENEF